MSVEIEKNGPGTVLVLVAHPDDAEFRCGGTLVLLAAAGWKVHIATMTPGDCGSAEVGPEEIAALRRREGQAAAERLGGSYHCLESRDLQVFDDNPTRAAAVALLRQVRPDCVITHYTPDYMPDHDAAAAVARMAVFTAPMPNYLVGPAAALPPTEGMVPLYYFGGPLDGKDWLGAPVSRPPHFFVDVSRVMDEKAALLGCHASQRDWLRRQHGIDRYIEQMREWDAAAGKAVGLQFAEGFYVHGGHAYPQTPVLEKALAGYIHGERRPESRE